MRSPEARRLLPRPSRARIGAPIAAALLLVAGAVAAQTPGSAPGGKPEPTKSGTAEAQTLTPSTVPPAGATADATRGTAAASASASPDKRPPYPETPARTPLAPGRDARTLAWKRHLEIGGDFAFVQRAASQDDGGNPSGIRYAPAVGFGVHARWELFKYLRFTAYFLDASHDVDMPAGVGYLGQSPTSSYEIEKVHTFAIGARLSPTLPLTERARAWVTLGVGWGRLEFGEMSITEGNRVITIDERADAFVEFPMGVGASFDLIPKWLSVEVEITGALVADQPGDALGNVQGHDNEGHLHDIGGFPVVDGTFVQTVGLSLVL